MDNSDYDFLLKTVATPSDYSQNLYLVYIELPVPNKTVHKIISKHCKIIRDLESGYLCEAHMQSIPEIARSLSLKNHAIYQIVRLSRITKS